MVVNYIFAGFAFLTLAIFIRAFGRVNIQEDIKFAFNESISRQPIDAQHFLALNVFFFVANLLVVSHLLHWQVLLENSWCTLNFHSRQKTRAAHRA